MTWQSNFPVYQIDFSVAAAGKRVASTKRRIQWRFGFPSPSAFEQGLTGTDCRGEEHDIVVVWSITSGKRQITMDSKEVHYSSNRAGLLDFSWTTKGNHVIKVICHASPPLSPIPGFRQYDLLVDGQSFYTMPKVYELGLKPGKGYGRGGGRSDRQRVAAAPNTRSEEDEELQKAIQASLEESRAHLREARRQDDRSAYTTGNVDLLNFSAPPAPQQPPPSDSRSVASFYSAPPPSYGAPYQPAPQPPVGPGALVPAVAPPGYYLAPPVAAPYAAPPAYASPSSPPPQASYARPPAPQYSAPPPQYAPSPVSAPLPTNLMNAQMQSNDVFGLNSAPGDDPFAPKPPGPATHNDFANVVLSAYSNKGPSGSPQAQQTSTSPSNGFAQNGSHVSLSMNGTFQNDDEEEDEPKSAVEKAMKKLVNVNRIDEPAEYGRKLTMMKGEEKKKPKGKSVPLPPVASGMIGQNATLSQISTVKGQNVPKTGEGVMKAPPPGAFSPGAAGGGALVVHGQGPPPLNQARGFGVGAQLPNGGMSNPQQRQQYYQQQQRY